MHILYGMDVTVISMLRHLRDVTEHVLILLISFKAIIANCGSYMQSYYSLKRFASLRIIFKKFRIIIFV